MNRRDRARQKKRKAREERLRQQKHAAHAGPAAPEPLDDDLPDEDLPDDDEPVSVDAPPLATPADHHTEERTLRRIRRAITSLLDASPADLQRTAASLANKTLEELDEEYGDDPVERAQDLAFRAWDTDDFD